MPAHRLPVSLRSNVAKEERVQTTYENTTISTFLEELSSAAPAPGGGSVAALSGAM
ncbi:cyclodeaminase/cyclohydrolase family protein, partial [Candidatus Bipolaricaulota bacterium]|nr:cyclodeaminase/cyclohydrolase family protein [Candidatus Bipolaricaulota bacterium]